MLKFIRYALATVCFALSAGGLALWWRSQSDWDCLIGLDSNRKRVVNVECYLGRVHLNTFDHRSMLTWAHRIVRWEGITNQIAMENYSEMRRANNLLFGRTKEIEFPLWYPAIIFALSGVGLLRLGRFTLRSAMIATAVVAGLLGMAVAM